MRRLATLLAVAVVVATGGDAWAYFTAGATGGSRGMAVAGALPAGNTPSASLAGRDVTVSWPPNVPGFLGAPLGGAGGGYTIVRYAQSGGGALAPGNACDGLRAGSTSTLSCTEESVPTGRWSYTVTPHYASWIGAESSRSVAVVVPPAAPTSVSLANGPYVNAANASSVDVDVTVPATSLRSDAVRLSVSDGSASVTASASPPVDGAATVHFTGIDTSSLADGALTFTAKSASAYGDDSGTTTSSYTKDTVAPVVTVGASRAADHNGWYNHAVTFTPTGTDATSGIASCQPATIYSGPDGTALTISLTCTDNAGNTGTGTSAAFKYDGTSPAVTVSPNRSPDANGWYNHAVTFTPAGTDATSGFASCQSAVTYSGPDATGLTVSLTCTDNAGNTQTGTSAVFKFDRNAPVVTVTPDRPPDSNGWYDAPVTWAASGTDAMSGIVSCQSLAYSGTDTSGVQVSRSCTDAAGNTGIGLSPPFKYDSAKPVIRAAIVNTMANVSGFLGQGGTYVVYADVTDALSGVDTASLTANVSAFGGGTAVPLAFNAAGFTVTNPDGGTSVYHYASGPLTAQMVLAEGAASVTVSGRDIAANTASQAASATVDNTAPVAAVALAAGQASSTSTQPIAFTVTFNEAVTGLATNGSGIVLGGTAGTSSATIAVTRIDATHYGVAVNGLSGPGTITAAASAGATTDLAGNADPASGVSPVVTFAP